MIKVAVGLIFRNQGKEVLLCQRKPESPYPLKWEFPGGKVKDGEDIEECLKRELLEELNINVLHCRLYDRNSFKYTSGTFDVFYLTVRRYEGIPSNSLFSDMRWVPITELNNYDHLAGNIPTLRKLLNEINTTR
jgi:8-oxo-dGTP diphosphatase